MHSPGSSDPSLSPGALTDTSAIDQYFDLDSLIDQSATLPEKQVLFADQLDGMEPLMGESSGMDSDQLYSLLMGQSIQKQPFQAPVEVPSMDVYSAESSVDPLALQTPSPLLPSKEPSEFEAEIEDDDDEMDQDDEPDYVESEEEEKPKTRSASKRKAASSGAKASSKKSVAALAMPMDDGKPVSAASSVHGKLPHMAFAVPDYIDRPAPEVYKKMSSKEKRQLRNKISARNFRHRRKEYITELEGQIAVRDETIMAMQSEMGALKEENRDLKKDVDMLRKQFEDALAKFTSSAPAAKTCAPSETATPLQPSTNAPRRGRSLVVPNFNKDVSPLSSWGPGGFSGVTRNLGVHHTILPERHPDLSGKPRHLNPLLDNYDPLALPSATSHLRQDPSKPDLHDEFMETNPYLLNPSSADAYRGQLYDKIFHNAKGWSQGQKTDEGRQFPADFRPAFFSSPGAALSGKPSLPSSSKVSVEEAEARDAAYVAGHASTTLFRRMATAFAEAFAGPSATSQVADVLAGRAQVRIVPTVAHPAPKTATEEVAERLAELRVSGSSQEVLKSA